MAGFPNLARGADCTAEVRAEVTAICAAELEAAGLKVFRLSWEAEGEVPANCIGHLSGWKFERAWYYWRADGPGIPPDIAERLHSTHGRQVRVDGHCGCPSPLEQRHGFAIGSYHVDTPEGLKALADTLRSIWDEDAQTKTQETT